MKPFKIGKLKIDDNKCIIIAEVGVNHNCNLKIARKLIREAKKMVLILLNFKLIKQKSSQ